MISLRINHNRIPGSKSGRYDGTWLRRKDDALRFRGKLTPAEYAEASRMLRTWSWWPKLLMRNLYGFLLLGVFALVTINAALTHAHTNWKVFGTLWFVVAALFAWAIFNSRHTVKKDLAGYNASAPDFFEIDEQGLRTENANGSTLSQSWKAFRSWQDSVSVVLLMAKGNFVHIIPLSEAPVLDAESLRGTLNSCLGPSAKK
jgi:hypothetical protein